MVGRKLDADPPFTGRVDDGVKPLVVEDVPVEHPCPERTLSVQVGGVENDHASYRFHESDSMDATVEPPGVIEQRHAHRP